MNYASPVQAVIPGVQGRVLAVLARTEAELTMRTVARLAGVSVNQASVVLNGLVSLGLAERREAGSAALVKLVRENEAARVILLLASLHSAVISRLEAEAKNIEPAPASLILFGSFANGLARETSDIDVLAVRAAGVEANDPQWVDSLGHWADVAHRISGNPINLLEASLDEMSELVQHQGSVWQAAVQQGLSISGQRSDGVAAGE